MQSGDILAVAAPLAAEVGRELSLIVSDPALKEQLDAEFGAPGSTMDTSELVERLKHRAREAAAAAAAGSRTTSPEAEAAAAAVAAGLLPGSLPGLLALLERLGARMVECGAPARAEATAAMLRRVRDELSEALRSAAEPSVTGAPDGDSALALGLSRALRLLQLLVKQIKFDAANARLMALSQKLKGGMVGVGYVQSKFLALHHLSGEAASPQGTESQAAGEDASSPAVGTARSPLPSRVAAALPKTWAWVRQSASALPAMQAYCSNALGGIDLAAAIATAAAEASVAGSTSGVAGLASGASLIPADLRSGVRAAPQNHPSHHHPPSSGQSPELRPRLPPLGGMQSPAGLARAGIVALVSGGSPAVGPALPEVLALDADRLHGLQNRFQSLVVVAASFLLVSQLRTQFAAQGAAAAAAASVAGSSPAISSDPIAPERTPQPPPVLDPQATKRRLQILLADPSLQLQHLVTELTSTAGLAAMGLPVEVMVRAEEQMRQGLLRVIDPAGAAFRSLSNALAASLLLVMLLGKEGVVVVAEAGASQQQQQQQHDSSSQRTMSVKAMVARLLGRVGGGIVAGDVEDLAEQMLVLAGVTEAVHLDSIYTPLFSQILDTVTEATAS